MRFAGQGLVAQPKWDPNPVMDEIPRWLNPRTGKLEPINKPEIPHGWPNRGEGGGPVHGWPDNKDWGSRIGQGGLRQMDLRDSDSDGIDDRDQLAPWQRNEKGNQIAGGSWLTPYRKEWIRHTSGQQPITDPVRRKELQDIILYPERVMGV